MVVEVVTMRMMVEVLIEVFFDNIFIPVCLEILSQFDNSLPPDANPLTSSSAATDLASCLLVNPSH